MMDKVTAIKRRSLAEAERMEAVGAPVQWRHPDKSVLNGGRRDAPGLPLEVFGDAWGQWIVDHAKGVSAPPDFVMGGLLPTAGALIGNARWVSPWPGWREPPVIWVANIGDPSSGKSPAMDGSTEMLSRMELSLASSYEEELRRWEGVKETAKTIKEAWQADVKQAVKAGTAAPDMPADAVEPEPPVRPRLYTSDPTSQSIGEILAAHPKGLTLRRDELTGWIGSFDRYGGFGADRAMWAEAFGGRPYVIDRVKHREPIKIAHLSVSVVGGIQPDMLAETLLSGGNDGLAARFLCIWPERVPPIRPSRVADDGWAFSALDRLRGLRMGSDDRGNPRPILVALAPEAAELFQTWRLSNHEDQASAAGLYSSHLGKLPGYVLRISLVLEFMKWVASDRTEEPESVSLENLAAAADLVDEYLRPMAARAYGDAALPLAERHAAAIARRITKEHPETINARVIRRDWRLPNLNKPEHVNDALTVLEEADWIRKAQKTGTGRPRADYETNPLIWRSGNGKME